MKFDVIDLKTQPKTFIIQYKGMGFANTQLWFKYVISLRWEMDDLEKILDNFVLFFTFHRLRIKK